MRTLSQIFRLVLVVIGSASGVSLAADSCAQLDSRWGRGPTLAVAYSDGTVLYGSGTELISVSAATDIELGRIDVGGVIYAVAVEGDHAYLAGWESGLIVVDVSDPAQMRVLAHTDAPSAASGVAVASGQVAVTDYWQDLWLFDVTNPSMPVNTGSFMGSDFPVDVELSGGYAVLAEQSSGIRVVDISNPANPTEVAHLATLDSANALAVGGSTIYVADGHAGLTVVDLASPSSPSVLGTLELSGSSTGIALEGQTAWIAADYGGFHAVDVTVPAVPALLGSSDLTAGEPVNVAVDGVRVWFAAWTAGAARVDGTDPSNPTEVAWYEGAGEARAVAALGEYAVVADRSGLALRVLNLSPAEGPEQIGSIELEGYPRHLEVASNKAYVAQEFGDFVVVDLTDPTNPIRLGSVAIPGNSQWVALAGDVAFVAAADDGLQVVDVSHPASPSVIGSVAIPGRASAVSVNGGIAYVAAMNAGLVVVDVSTPSSPAVLSSLDLGAVALHTAPVGDHVYVSGYYSGLFSVDVSDPANPVLDSRADPSGTARSAAISGDLAFVADGRWGVVVVDISDPSAIAVTGWTETPGNGYHGAFVGSSYVLADDGAGVAIFDVTGCGQAPTPPHADFSFTPAEPRVGDTVSFTDLSTGNPTNWGWWFSDDGSTSSLQNPTHIFSSAGAHQVRLDVANQNGSSTATRTIVVYPAAGEMPPVNFPFTAAVVIPAAAHVGGAQGTAWVTDLVLHNPSTEAATAYLFFLESEVDSSDADARLVTVPGNQSYLYLDVVADVFGASRSTGAILVGSDRPLTVSSRTYNNSTDGTFGQFIAGVDLNDALISGGRATVIQLSAGSFRSNLGVANVCSETIDVAAEVYSETGQLLDTRYLRVPPWSHLQINGVFARAGQPAAADGYAVLRCDTLDARWFAYASVVDNRSGDPVFVAPAVASSEPLWITAAARVAGANDTDWSTDLELFAGAVAPSSLSVKWHGPEGGAPREANVGFTGSPCQRVEDVLTGLFADDGAGALRIEGDRGELAVTSRTFNDTGEVTYGQYIAAMPESDALVWGETARLVQLAHSPDPDSGFRTNLGFVNTTAIPTTVMVELRDWDGSFLGRLDVELGRRQYLQINNVFDNFTDRTLVSPYAVLATSTGGASYFAYASVVDNRSGDPVFIPAVRER